MFVKDVRIDVNWLLNQILGAGKTKYQITKITDDQLFQFLTCLKDNPFTMHNDQNALSWIRERLALRYDQAQNQMSEQWEHIRQRYRFIIQQIDLILVKQKDRSAPPVSEPTKEAEVNFTVSFSDDPPPPLPKEKPSSFSVKFEE